MSEEYIFGAHILESLTRGMYQDSKTIFREYIQNSCDAVDDAVKAGILCRQEGRIDIELDAEERSIIITDNGVGVKAEDFRRVMGNVADSDKRQGENRGFRGIGRLCGLAYCDTVIFTAKYKGESIISKLVCNADILRQFLNDRNSGINRYTASEVLEQINEFTNEETDDIDAHYFKVELYGINEENAVLLNYSAVKDYLSFTAPLPYSITFDPFGGKIHKHADELGQKIDEYRIYLNDEQLFKLYTLTYPTRRGEDEISSIEFYEIRDKNAQLTAWLWYGISCFRGVIDKDTLMRGIRLRKGNIQVGDEATTQRFFKEEKGNRYFIGEVFCLSDGLLPNSRRDYFNENPECVDFERAMVECAGELTNLYRKGSDLNSSYRRAKQAEDAVTEIRHRIINNYFNDNASKEKAEAELKLKEDEATRERKKIENIASSDAILRRIAKNIENRHTYPAKFQKSSISAVKYSQAEQRLLQKVFGIIHDELGKTADSIIRKIKEGLSLQ